MGTLSKHFDTADVTRSQEAARRGIDNDLPLELVSAVKATADMLERIRAYLSEKPGHDVPIIVTSWYRSPALNAAVGSSATSDHLKGCAVDIVAPAFGSPKSIAVALAPMVGVLGIGQLISEFPDSGNGWVHVSTRIPEKLVNRIITITRAGTQIGIAG